ncbi:unnamed protein product [Rotaria sp. Silwood2]|nr:unnamed protein product [Rotaria sp. Silwood2]CAF3889041.1 unnamed protein product [Rotaria sp. Silwood2]
MNKECFVYAISISYSFRSPRRRKQKQISETFDAVSAIIWQLLSSGGIRIPRKSTRKDFNIGKVVSLRKAFQSSFPKSSHL